MIAYDVGDPTCRAYSLSALETRPVGPIASAIIAHKSGLRSITLSRSKCSKSQYFDSICIIFTCLCGMIELTHAWKKITVNLTKNGWNNLGQLNWTLPVVNDGYHSRDIIQYSCNSSDIGSRVSGGIRQRLGLGVRPWTVRGSCPELKLKLATDDPLANTWVFLALAKRIYCF